MSYKLTTATDITNAGANIEVKEFDTFNELQDYMQEQTADMSRVDYELYMAYSRIEWI